MQIPSNGVKPGIVQNTIQPEKKKGVGFIMKGEVKGEVKGKDASDKDLKASALAQRSNDKSEGENRFIIKGEVKAEEPEANPKKAMDKFMQENPSRVKVNQKG